ncbi:MAG: hypothetical protein OER96_01355 [Gammaproteobacteria bacterium]|nr:hypothetical protein [Gammaproteobacteria bacterium]
MHQVKHNDLQYIGEMRHNDPLAVSGRHQHRHAGVVDDVKNAKDATGFRFL